jgi:xyloglucan-specific exo-beta-1,4-glucanase
VTAPRMSRRGLLVLGAAAAATPVLPAAAAVRSRYRWRNAAIVGGGFVPGIIFNQSERDLVYARTDIGGCYRLDRGTDRWIPLLDWIGWDDWGHTGVVSLATDEVDPDRVYAAVGTYTVDAWDPTDGAVLCSRDRGRTWRVSPLPFHLGGNMPGRGIGERLAIDPSRNSILYLGVRGGFGLWRSTDFGRSWAQVTSFPNPGDFVPDPGDPSGYSSDNAGVLQTVFDKRGSKGGKPTQTIYVTVADTENILYRSTDAGSTWARVPGQPTGFIPHKMVLDPVGGYLYLATSDTVGPYDGGKGDVWKLDTATGAWTCVSPVPSTDSSAAFGYSGLTIDRQHPGTLLVATQIMWWPDIQMFRSTDGGASWTRAWDWGTYPQRVPRYSLDITAAPWLTWNATPALPEIAPKLGWMTESVEIDPFDSDRFLYGTGATVYGADNLTAWDTGGTVAISVRAKGLEETSVGCVLSPPVGAHLYSAVKDVGGFVHHDLNAATTMYDSPTFGATVALDFAELAPATIVRVGAGDPGGLALSTDSGATWTAATVPDGITGPGADDSSVALSADGTRVVWSPAGAPVVYSTDRGVTWQTSAGLAPGTPIRADRVKPMTFYAFAGGTFLVSTDGAATFTATAASGLPTEGGSRFKPVPGRSGDIWLAGGKATSRYGLWRSVDSGASFSKLPQVDEGDVVGFGKAAPGRSYPAVYTSAKINGVRGVFRSDDAGVHWVRVNDDRHQYAWTGNTITGDPRVYGRVFLGTNGRGIIYGDLE